MSYADIHGWNEEDLRSVYRDAVAAATDGDVLVEVGVAYGKSLAYLVEQVEASGKDLVIVAVDLWDGTWCTGREAEMNAAHGGFCEAFEASMNAHCPAWRDRVVVARGPSAGDAGALLAWVRGLRVTLRRPCDERASFVFLDAAHDYESVRADVAAWAPVVRSGGTLAGHDHASWAPGVERAVREAFGSDYVVRGCCWIKEVR